jgi:hypothetical protein
MVTSNRSDRPGERFEHAPENAGDGGGAAQTTGDAPREIELGESVDIDRLGLDFASFGFVGDKVNALAAGGGQSVDARSHRFERGAGIAIAAAGQVSDPGIAFDAVGNVPALLAAWSDAQAQAAGEGVLYPIRGDRTGFETVNGARRQNNTVAYFSRSRHCTLLS